MQLWIWERRLKLLTKMRFGYYGKLHIDLTLITVRIIFKKIFNPICSTLDLNTLHIQKLVYKVSQYETIPLKYTARNGN